MSTKKTQSVSGLHQMALGKENFTPNGASSLAHNGKVALQPIPPHHFQGASYHHSSTHSVHHGAPHPLQANNPYLSEYPRLQNFYAQQYDHESSRLAHRSFGNEDSTGKPTTTHAHAHMPGRVRLNTTRLHLDGMSHHPPHILTGGAAHVKSSRNKSRDSLGPSSHNNSVNSGSMHIYTRGGPLRKHIQIGSQSTKHGSIASNALLEGGGIASSRGSAIVHHANPHHLHQHSNQGSNSIHNSGVRSHSANSFQKKHQQARPLSNITNHINLPSQSAHAPPPSIAPRRPSIRKIQNIPVRSRITFMGAQGSSRSGSMERSQPSHRSSSAQQRLSQTSSEVKSKRKRLDEFYMSLERDLEKDMLPCDFKDRKNPQFCGEYATQIIQYIGAIEDKYLPTYGYLKKQTDINDRMRSILVDWLVDVHLKFKLLPETLYLTVNMIDRYLQTEVISRRKLQLVGISSMLISSKYQEIYPPEIKDFTYITDRAYTKQDVLEMESQILGALEFNVTVPSCYRFLERFARLSNLEIAHTLPTNATIAGSTGLRTFMFARYLTELALVDYNMLKFTPRQVAASSIYIALRLMKFHPPWNENLTRASGLTEAELKPCARQIMTLLDVSEKHNLKAVRKKYSQKKFMEVAKIKIDLPSKETE